MLSSDFGYDDVPIVSYWETELANHLLRTGMMPCDADPVAYWKAQTISVMSNVDIQILTDPALSELPCEHQWVLICSQL